MQFIKTYTIEVSNLTPVNEAMNNTITVDTECGRVRGKQELTLFIEKPFYSFKGIPYAKPPVAQLRFKV